MGSYDVRPHNWWESILPWGVALKMREHKIRRATEAFEKDAATALANALVDAQKKGKTTVEIPGGTWVLKTKPPPWVDVSDQP